MGMLHEYLRELRQVKMLSPEEERDLWRRYKETGDVVSRETLIRAYQPLVIKIVSCIGTGLAQEMIMDLIQEGTVGLIEAVETYDPGRGVLFATYAWPRIRGRVLNYLRGHLEAIQHLLSWEEAAAVRPLPAGEARFHDPAEAVDRWDLISRLAGAWRRLPEKEQAVMAAVYVEDQPAEKAALRLQISASHFYRLQRQALRRMRGILSREAGELREG